MLRRALAYRSCTAAGTKGRTLVTAVDPVVLFTVTKAAVYPYYYSDSGTSQPLLSDLSLIIKDGQAWAIVASSSSSSRAHLISVLLNSLRCVPPPRYPFLASLPPTTDVDGSTPRPVTVSDAVQLVAFKTRLSTTGMFEDYSARYFSIRDEDTLTVRQHLERSLPTCSSATSSGDQAGEEETDVILETAKLLEMESFLELPLVTLSNGQNRRERIMRALIAKPELLILEEPFTGLDVSSRLILSNLLARLHHTKSPRILFVLRPLDLNKLPEGVTHVALVDESLGNQGRVYTGTKAEILASPAAKALIQELEHEQSLRESHPELQETGAGENEREVLVHLENVGVSYSDRKILSNITWTVRAGERWVLSGHNGSGKSTLLSLVLGDHPASFSQAVTIFGKERIKQATNTIQNLMGHVSPEISAAFPRRYGPAGLTNLESIITGFDSIYCYRGVTAAQTAQIKAVLHEFNYPLLTDEFLQRPFAEISHGEQSLVLIIRALVKRPKLLILDEPFAGMDGGTIKHLKTFLNEGLHKSQAAVIISHYEDEIPSSFDRVLKLEAGRIVELN